MTGTMSPGRRITVTFASADPARRRDDVTDPDPLVAAVLWRVAAAARAVFAPDLDAEGRHYVVSVEEPDMVALRAALADLDAVMATP